MADCVCYNRTYVELKFRLIDKQFTKKFSYNRTYVELKLGTA